MKTIFKTFALLTLLFSGFAASAGDAPEEAKKEKAATTRVYDLAGTLQAELKETSDRPENSEFLFSYEGVDYYMVFEKSTYNGTLKEVHLD